MLASMTTPLASVNVPLLASSVTRSFFAVRLPLTLIEPLSDLSRMLPSLTAAVPAVTAPVAKVPVLTNEMSPPGFEADTSVATVFDLSSDRVGPLAETVSLEALMRAVGLDSVIEPAAVSVTSPALITPMSSTRLAALLNVTAPPPLPTVSPPTLLAPPRVIAPSPAVL